MTTYFAKPYVGTVRDGTTQSLVDGRLIDAKDRRTVAEKDNTNALLAADKMYIGRVPQGAAQIRFSGFTDTSFGSSTISIGTIASPTKYVNAQTLTALLAWTALPLTVAAALAAPLASEEELYMTIGTATVPAVVKAAIAMQYTISA